MYLNEVQIFHIFLINSIDSSIRLTLDGFILVIKIYLKVRNETIRCFINFKKWC